MQGLPNYNEEIQGEAGRKLRVLLVEDHRDTAKSMAQLLRVYGHDVTVATDGIAALDAVRAELPDVVLLDIALPKMDGHDVARRLADICPEKKPYLVAVSGYGGEEVRLLSAQAGINMHLPKPVDPIQLQQLLAQVSRRADGVGSVVDRA